MSRKFGVELEMNGISRDKAVRVLSAIGIDIQSEGYNHSTRSYWKIVSDASVRNGFEVVSPVLEGEAGLEQLRAVVTALNDAGGKVDRSCGFHVHFDATDLSVEHIRAIVTRYAKHEANIDAFMPGSRRGDANRYCRSLTEVVARPGFCGAANISQLATAQGGRYFKVNLQSYQVHGTVEFRQHSGTLDAPKAVNWVRFLGAFIEECRAKADGQTVPAVAPALQAEPSRLAGVQRHLADLFQANTLLSLNSIMEQFGWQAHTVRAAVTSARIGGAPAYRLEATSPAAATIPARADSVVFTIHGASHFPPARPMPGSGMLSI